MQENVTKYDTLIHAVCESPLSQETLETGVLREFPDFSFDEDQEFNDQYLTDYTLEKYAYYRSLGLGVSEAAHAIEVSSVLMSKLLKGEGLSLDTFISLAKAELFSVPSRKAEHLKNLDQSESPTASKTFLEKVFPSEYNAPQEKVQVTVTNNLNIDPEKQMKARGIPIPAIEIEDVK